MTQTHTVTIHHEGETYSIKVPEDQTILQAARDADVALPYSCTAGVCTTCAAQIQSGTVVQEDAMGVSPELQVEGYALLCVSFPRSDIQLESAKEEEIYQRQFGQPS